MVVSYTVAFPVELPVDEGRVGDFFFVMYCSLSSKGDLLPRLPKLKPVFGAGSPPLVVSL